MRGSFFLSVSDSRSGVCRGSLGPAEGWFGKPGRVLRRSDDRRHTVVSVRASRTGYKVAMKSAPRCLRLSPAFRLQRVGAADASLLKRVGQDDLPRDYGILWPTRRSHTIKILSPELAEYLEGVQAEREGLPGLEELGPAGLNLMFDGILEWREDGRWQTGAAHLPPAPSQVVDREDRGILALLEARTRPDLSPAALATFLYEYGRKPFSSRWVARVGGSTQDDFEKWIGLAARSRIHAISSRWRATRAQEWWHWQRYRVRQNNDQATWKLYVNVQPEWLPEALSLVAEVLDDGDAIAFKVAGHARAALRPDKLVVYFAAREPMARAAAVLGDAAARLPVQPLPFSGRFSTGEVITWGLDPPRRYWMARGSWRSWICAKNAAITWALRGCAEGEFLDRLALRLGAEGVSPDQWLPAPSLMRSWSAETAVRVGGA